MEQYNSNTAAVIEFLKAERFSPSVISQHNLCYHELEAFITAAKQSYSFETAIQWVEDNKQFWPYRKYTSYKHCIQQLEDVRLTGRISAAHLCYRKPPYDLLSPGFKDLLHSFTSDPVQTVDDQYRVSCSRFLLYLQNEGLNSIVDLGYRLVLQFHEDNYHTSQKSKDRYEDHIRVFLRYLASNGKCSFGLSLALNKLLIPHILCVPSEELERYSNPCDQSLAWDDVLSFLSGMKKARYSKTVLKCSRHILTLLYIFLDMHHVGINKKLVWFWFNRVRSLSGSVWKQHRRTLFQFLLFLDTGTIQTAVTGNPNEPDSLETLQEWERSPIYKYLKTLKREGRCPSTIAMYRSCCLRFSRYLNRTGIQSFNEVTPEIVKEFNLQDMHGTPAGKSACNSRIRGFIEYLYEEDLVKNPYLYKALPTLTAPKTSIVKILSKEDVASIWSVDPGSLSPRGLRDYAIVCIGLTMGFRATDIVSIRFSDVNWQQRCIGIVQQKTGKSLTMPMPVKTGNILFRYIRDGRPKSDSPYIFVRHEAPYDQIQRTVCRRALKRFVTALNEQSSGFHIVRKTFATGMLAGNVNIELISDSLGHSTDETVCKYLSLDEERMRLCPLSLAESGISYKGGAFHA